MLHFQHLADAIMIGVQICDGLVHPAALISFGLYN